VLLKEADQAALDRGLATIQLNYANSVKRGRFPQQVAEERLKRITPRLLRRFLKRGPGYRGCVRRHGPQEGNLQELDRVCKPGAILASNNFYAKYR